MQLDASTDISAEIASTDTTPGDFHAEVRVGIEM